MLLNKEADKTISQFTLQVCLVWQLF